MARAALILGLELCHAACEVCGLVLSDDASLAGKLACACINGGEVTLCMPEVPNRCEQY